MVLPGNNLFFLLGWYYQGQHSRHSPSFVVALGQSVVLVLLGPDLPGGTERRDRHVWYQPQFPQYRVRLYPPRRNPARRQLCGGGLHRETRHRNGWSANRPQKRRVHWRFGKQPYNNGKCVGRAPGNPGHDPAATKAASTFIGGSCNMSGRPAFETNSASSRLSRKLRPMELTSACAATSSRSAPGNCMAAATDSSTAFEVARKLPLGQRHYERLFVGQFVCRLALLHRRLRR